MKLPVGTTLYESDKYKLFYDIKSLLSIGLVLSGNNRFIILLFGFTFFNK